MLQGGALAASQGDDPGPGRKVDHRESVEAAGCSDLEAPEQERLLLDIERGEYVEPERSAHEPGRREVRRRTDMREPEAGLERLGEVPIEDPHRHRHLVPAVPELIADSQCRLDVRRVVARQDRHR